MPLLDMTSPEMTRFFIENYHKTALLRMKWNELHKERLAATATLTREEKGYRESDVTAEAMRAGLATITRDYASGASNRKQVFIIEPTVVGISALRKGHSIVDIGLGDPKEDPRLARPDTDLQKDPKMRPVDPKQREILDIGKPFYGTKVYLNKREHILPEDKFYFPETTTWEYGWRLKDSYFGKPTFPKYGHVCRF